MIELAPKRGDKKSGTWDSYRSEMFDTANVMKSSISKEKFKVTWNEL